MNTMNRHTTLAMTIMAFIWLGIALRPSDAFGQQKTLKELIVGTWILESVYDQTADGVKHNPWGDGVKGFFWEFRGILKGGLERFRDAGHRTL